MMNQVLNLRAGAVVQVRPESEILAQLEADGTYEGVPFIPEMQEFCGRIFRVFKRAEKICVEGHPISRLRDTVFLNEVRCDGSCHDGCKRMCLIFWKEAWLSRAPNAHPEPPTDWLRIPGVGVDKPITDKTYHYCQSTALPRVAEQVNGWDPRIYIRDVTSRSFTPWQIVKAILIRAYNKLINRTGRHEFGAAIGHEPRTPEISLDLKQGELVEVRSKAEIIATIDHEGKNRGLRIDYEMLRHAGKRFRVLRRADRIILETTGKMREIKNTVILENCACEGLCRSACARNSHPMWREAWLKRVNEPSKSN